MATVVDTDWSVNFVNGEIRFTGGASTTNTGLELHRWLQLKAAEAQAAGGANNDIIDISSLDPSERITDEIINLKDQSGNGGPRYNIDDTAAEHLYGCSLRQGSGATQELYSGLRVLGAVVSSDTQLMVIQDKDLYQFTTTDTAPFWLTQATGGLNGDATKGVLMRILIKSRVNGADIDAKKVIVQCHNYGDTYSAFEVELGTAEAVAAVSSVDDPQNDTAFGPVTAYTHVTNSGGTANAPTGGFQEIDIGDGNGDQPYYSQWTYGADTSGNGFKGVWEYHKDLTKTGSAKTVDGIVGEMFRGITHSYIYDNLSGGPFTEREEVVWGTAVTYDSLASGPFVEGNYIRFGTGGNSGRIMYDPGANGTMIIALDDLTDTIKPIDTEVMTEYNPSTGATGATAAVDTSTPVADSTKDGGLGVLLANDTTGLEHHIQLRTGIAPVDNLEIYGLTSGATCDVDTTITARTISPVFTGNYVGSLIGAYGVGVLPANLSFPDTVQDLDGDINSAPNNVTFSVNGVEIGEDYVMVGEKDGTYSDFKWTQSTINGALSGAGIVAVTVASIPANTPSAGFLRLTATDARRIKLTYTSYTGLVYTIASHDFSGDDAAADGNDIIVMPIDKLAASDPETYTATYTAPMTLWVRVRDGGAAGDTVPIKPIDQQASLGSGGGSTQINRLSDA